MPENVYIGTNKADTLGTIESALIIGAGGNDTIRGNYEDDALFGGRGDDYLYGSRGNDILDGGAGNDILAGGNDTDQLFGGEGADRFVYYHLTESHPGRVDTIWDFDKAEGDTIEIREGVAAQFSILRDGTDTWVRANTDSDRAWEFQLRIKGDHALTVADLVL